MSLKDKEIEIGVCLSSEKESASLGFGKYYSIKEHPDGPGTDWIIEGMGDAFNENYYEFEPGIERARKLVCMNPQMSSRDALFEVFGNFTICYEVDGIEKNWNYDINLEDLMYSFLEDYV